MKLRGIAVFLALLAVLVLAGGALALEKAALWDGKQWTQMPYDAKVGYVAGVGNMADFDLAAGKGKVGYASRAFSTELRTKTVNQVVEEVDNFYKTNPNKLGMSVLEVIAMKCASLCPPGAAGVKK